MSSAASSKVSSCKDGHRAKDRCLVDGDCSELSPYFFTEHDGGGRMNHSQIKVGEAFYPLRSADPSCPDEALNETILRLWWSYHRPPQM
jgi:ferredoxin